MICLPSNKCLTMFGHICFMSKCFYLTIHSIRKWNHFLFIHNLNFIAVFLLVKISKCEKCNNSVFLDQFLYKLYFQIATAPCYLHTHGVIICLCLFICLFTQYSRTPHNPYLSVDGPGYGLWGGMGLKEHGKNRVEKSWINRKKY